jgi:hypothetical protein
MNVYSKLERLSLVGLSCQEVKQEWSTWKVDSLQASLGWKGLPGKKAVTYYENYGHKIFCTIAARCLYYKTFMVVIYGFS